MVECCGRWGGDAFSVCLHIMSTTIALDRDLDILAFGAHPDDVEFSCAGTMILMHRKGHATGVVDLTRGEMGTRGSAKIRAREAQNAAKVMGLAARRNVGLPDGGVEITKNNIKKVVALIREFRPRIILIPHAVDRHPDHEHASRLVREAAFYSGLIRLSTTTNGEKQTPFRPEVTLCYRQSSDIPATIIVDITSVFEEKMKTVFAYASQVYNPKAKEPDTVISRPEFIDNIEARARAYGSRIGVKYGEAFYSPNPLWCDDLMTVIPQKPRMM